MEPTFGYLVSDLARLLRKAFDQRARLVGLSLTQCRAIVYLDRHEGINQACLAELMEVQPITLARLLDRMGAAGWVERCPDPNDRRAHRLYLTDKAKPLIEQIQQLSAETRTEMLGDLGTDELERTMHFLTQVHANLSKRMQAAPAPTPPDNDAQDTDQ